MWFFLFFFSSPLPPPPSSFSSSTFFNEGEIMHFLWGCCWVFKCWWGVVTWRRCARDPLSVWVCVWISPTALKLSLSHTRKNINGGVAHYDHRWNIFLIKSDFRLEKNPRCRAADLCSVTCNLPFHQTKCGTCSTLLELLRHLYLYSLYHIVKDSFDTWEWIPLK